MVLANEELNVIDKKKSDLQNLLRLTENTINLINEAKFDGNLAIVILESLNWLKAIQADIRTQLDALTPAATEKVNA